MQWIGVRGLVKLADSVRHELTQPIAPARLGQLRKTIADAVRTVDTLLRERRADLNALPPPSRNAYRYLTSLDMDSISTTETVRREAYTPASIRYNGLRSFLDNVLDSLSTTPDGSELVSVHASIRETSRNVEHDMLVKGIEPLHLKPESCRIRAWLAYFGQAENLETYVTAVGLAKPIMDEAADRSPAFAAGVIIHFRPTTMLFRSRRFRNATRLHLPTPMITFDSDGFASLATMVFNDRGGRRGVVDRTHSPRYRAVQSDLDRLAGKVDHSSGMSYDLGDSFDRVNAAYFQGEMPRPGLTWSRQVTGRKFGHYDSTRDVVMVSMSLDTPAVPAYVVDFVVYHELLHKRLGVHWQNDRRAVHTPAFRREERRFRQYDLAEAALRQLAQRYA